MEVSSVAATERVAFYMFFHRLANFDTEKILRIQPYEGNCGDVIYLTAYISPNYQNGCY